MLSAVGLGPLMGPCRQQGGSLSLDSMHINVCVVFFSYVCFHVCLYLQVCVHICVHVQRHSASVSVEGMETESL